MEELRRRAWKIVEPRSRARVEQSVVAFHEAMSKGRGASELRAVAEAAAAGRVAALLVDADRHVPGRIEPATGTVHLDDMANPQVDDLFDDIAELVLAGKGDVLVVPGERMPTDSGVAAIHRY
jgi:Bacterial archaeo-eukaryotic release factor family 3